MWLHSVVDTCWGWIFLLVCVMEVIQWKSDKSKVQTYCVFDLLRYLIKSVWNECLTITVYKTFWHQAEWCISQISDLHGHVWCWAVGTARVHYGLISHCVKHPLLIHWLTLKTILIACMHLLLWSPHGTEREVPTNKYVMRSTAKNSYVQGPDLLTLCTTAKHAFYVKKLLSGFHEEGQ